jgi:2-aminoadipate transaminase
MRLNFSGSSDEEIREGVRRIGMIVAEQVELYDTLTGHRAVPATQTPAGEAETAPLADVVQLRRRGATEDRRSREV